MILRILMTLLLSVVPAQAATDVVGIRGSALIDRDIEWCFTTADVTLETLATSNCRWQPLRTTDYRHGFENRVAWLRFSLSNSSDAPLERWIEVGHPRLKRIDLHYRTAEGPWTTSAVGFGVPLAEREFIARHYDVNPVTIEPGSETEIIVRVQSEAQMALDTLVWDPNAFRERRQVVDVWLAIAVGAMLLGIVFAAAAFINSREWFYLMFLLVLVGELILETVRTGFMARHLWPATLPVPIGLMALGSLIATIGFIGYALRMLGGLSRDPLQRRGVLGLLGGVVLFQMLAMVWDYGLATTIWTVLFAPLAIWIGWASFREARNGGEVARWILWSVVLLFVVGMLRMPPVMRHLPHYLNDFISPLSTMVVILVVVFSLVERERKTRRALRLSQTEAAAQVAFLARMSHEFRTPLDIILGNAQLLMRLGRRPLAAEKYGQAELGSILQSGRHLLGLVDEILDYARGLCGELKLRPEPLVLHEFMTSVEAGARVLAVRNRNVLELHELPDGDRTAGLVLQVDVGRLRQILDNLISNACRHTTDGSIRLAFRGQRVSTKQWRIHFQIADTGDGIAREDQERIFEPFERLRSDSRYGRRGAGMGLAVAKQLVTLMGGSLRVDSEPGRGSTFLFDIMAESTGGLAASVKTNNEDLRETTGYVGVRRSVLIVDDNLASRATIAGMLAEAGFEVLLAESGNEAVRRLSRAAAPDLIVTDQFMADGDGWLVLAEASTMRIPCALVSAALPAPPENWPAEHRFDATFMKPLDHADFLHRIGKLLDLEWVRSTSPAPSLTPLVFPNDDELAELTQMLELGEITVIMDWARRLRHIRPECAAFADRVAEAATDLDLEALQGLAKRTLS
jgi:signal transduction histidine kinase/CheY-like chemotaxis protein